MILSTHGFIGSQIVQFTGLLDTYPNAAAAYSLRLLRSAYTGDAIRVRRASDNNEQDIGFVNNELDTSSLTTFCSGTNGFVKTWYDQSGNGNDASQTTAESQPQIVSNGSVLLQNGKPKIQPIATPGMDTGIKANATMTSFTVSNVTDFNGPYRIISSYSGSGGIGNGFLCDVFNNIRLFALSGSVTIPISTLYNLIVSKLISGTSISVANNGSSFTSSSVISTLNSLNNIFIGEDATGIGATEVVNGLQEIIIYNSDQSSNRTGIETNINDFYSIY